ncbi:MAG: DUF2283 domain-containing protein [Leptospiraceae bacterium]|nr:DUF2283 domain-containing protein [Leptospiraceae bacterium]
MKLIVDEKTDSIYFRLSDSKIQESEEVSPGFVLDFDSMGQIVGIEILAISKRTDKINLKNLSFEIADNIPK